MKKINWQKGILLLAVLAFCGMLFLMGATGEEAVEKREEVSGTIPTAAVQETESSQYDTLSPSPELSHGAVIKKHKDGGAVWTYNTRTRCLVISGEGKISTEEEGDTSRLSSEELEYSGEENCYRPQYYKKVEKIIIKAGITYINEGAFEGYSRLEKVVFDSQSNCRQIGYAAFQSCRSLREIRLPDSVERVGAAAFRDCKSLQRVYLGSSFLGGDPGGEVLFSNNKNLKEVTVSASNPKYSSKDGVLYNKSRTKLLYYPRAKRDRRFDIPDTVETVRASSFGETRYLEEVSFPKSLKLIGYNAFVWSKSLKSVNIQGKNVVIRSRAFSMCQSLVQVTLGDGVREIRDEVFYDNPDLREIHIPASVVKIGKDAFGIWLYRENREGGGGSVSRRDVKDFTIYGKTGSAAQRYAEKHVFDFVAER